jgi:hypothetical protein
MPLIDIDAIRSVSRTSPNTIAFTDNQEEYAFNVSKSTLYKRFITPENPKIVNVEIIEDPFEVLERLLSESGNLIFDEEEEKPYVYLPLYSSRNGQVYPGSGLNAWNADGRPRHPDEIYIPIPIDVRRSFPNFFPDRDTPFVLELPDGTELEGKASQDGGKALTSNPNRALGEWLLRDVLKLEPGTLVTNEILEDLGIDSVIVTKEDEGRFSINFTKSGSYEEFSANLHGDDE